MFQYIEAFKNDLICNLVELAGVEPASKQETERLSTCLSCHWFSRAVWQQAAELHLSPLFLPANQDSLPTIPSHEHHWISKRQESSPSDVLSQALSERLSLIYFIRLSSKSKIIFAFCCLQPLLKLLLREPACLHFHLPCCQNRSAPFLSANVGNIWT